ncbi:histone methyltransferase set2 [Knufia obscura]|uniref:Histone methyltransferase set2 n=1 Tax=Knufia obscura TaxID=1635080 RepID=A0ABR0RJS2_9EURO|nr:histone methyltransferase set2 [Knufia obscura]
MNNDLAQGMSSTRMGAIKDEPVSRSNTPLSAAAKLKTNPSSSASTPRPKSETEEAATKVEDDITNGHELSDMEQLVRPKKGVRSSKKNPARIAPLFDDLPDATMEANSAYTVIDSCSYQNKYLGYTEHAMECDCAEEWGKF